MDSRFAEVEATRHPDGRITYRWIGPSHWPLRLAIGGDLPRGEWPWRVGFVREEYFRGSLVIARADGWRVCTWRAYWLQARAAEVYRCCLRAAFLPLHRSGWLVLEPGVCVTLRQIAVGLARGVRAKFARPSEGR